MTHIRWMAVLIAGLLISGCSVLQSFITSRHDTPTSGADIRPITPPELMLLQGDSAFPMDTGSFCWTMGDNGLCADAVPPRYTEDMHRPVTGTTFELQFDAPSPDTIHASLHPGSNMMTRIAEIAAEVTVDENGRVLVTVPDNVDGNYVLSIFATWSDESTPHGDASYFMPVRFER
ncbi:MAG: hypothetical protein IT320_19685 [Anaerolineae bacterium]|nr:hypothetical protein [Anaerolineae bacterium]